MIDLKQIAKDVGDEPFHAQQKWTELADLMKFLKPRRPKNILEIGVYKGGTVMAWTYIADHSAKITGVDLPGGSFGGGFNKTQSKRIKELARHDQTINLLALDSHAKSTVNKIAKNAPYEFIFIDGDHTYEGVKQDFDNYFPMLAKGGVLALHDIVDHHSKTVKVHELWAEIKPKYKTKEFIDLDFPTDSGMWGGIGCIIK